MTPSDVENKIKGFFVTTVLEGDSSDLDRDTPLLKTGLLNSMTVIMLVDFVETEFGITLGPEQLMLDRLENIGVIAAEIVKLQST